MYEYPFGNGQQLNLDWFLAEWKNLLAAWEAEKNGIAGALDAEIAKAEAALADVFAARDAAAQSAANALESKNAAAQSASDASGYLATVHADANTASNAAQNAAQSESNAAKSAQTALASKNAAGQSERNAAQSEANANSSKNAAAQSASDADASKSAAAQSAADALANKNAAAQSAEDASDAAASVEASAQQIATNTGDISNLKESSNINFGHDQIKTLLKDCELTFPGNAILKINNNIFSVENGSGSAYYQIIGVQKTNPRVIQSTSGSLPDKFTINDFTTIPQWLKLKPTTFASRQLDLIASIVNVENFAADDSLALRIYAANINENDELTDIVSVGSVAPTRAYQLTAMCIFSYNFNCFGEHTHYCVVVSSQSRAKGKKSAISVNLAATTMKMLEPLSALILENN